MHTMSEITKSDVKKLEAAKSEFLGFVENANQAAGAFMRRALLGGVEAIDKLHRVVEATEGGPSIDKLHLELADGEGRVSKSTLDRWGRVAKFHRERNIPITEASASAYYAVTEGGWTAARKQLDAVAADVSSDDLVEAVREATEANPRVKSSSKPKQLESAADVENAAYTPEAFAESVRALIMRVPEADRPAALKQLGALHRGLSKELANA